MTGMTARDRLLATRPDWFAGLDERIPVSLLRLVADSRPVDLAPALVAVMEIAHRRLGVEPKPARWQYRRRAVVEPPALPRDIGRRLLAELRDLTDGDVRDDLPVLAGVLATRLGLPAEVVGAALAVALTVSPHEPAYGACPTPDTRIPSPRPFSAPVAALVPASG